MAEYEELHLTVQNVNTRLFKGGTGPDLIYLHGAGGGGNWLPHLDLLAERFTVYAPDHPGWGGSEGPEWMDTMQDYALHYDALIRVLQLDRAILVGHSLGGWMAAEIAVTYPDRLAALALVNAAGFPFDNTSQHLQSGPDFFATAARGGEDLARMIFHKMDVAVAYFTPNPTAEDTLRRYRELTSTARLAWHTWFDAKLPRRLARVTSPALALWGEHDALFPAAQAHAYAQALPRGRARILSDCGHMVPVENPLAMREAITDLWREVS